MSHENDQAASLRARPKVSDGDKLSLSKKAVCCMAVASGKGGVGKTFVAVNLAVSLGRLKKKVLLVDADLGLANADIVLGVHPEFSMQDALFKGKALQDVIVATPYGVDLLAASSGSKEMVSLGAARMGMFIKDLQSFASGYDVLIFDCAAGIDSSVTAFLAASPQNIIVATAQPTSIMDVYALMKIIHQDKLSDNVSLLVNMVSSDEQGMRVANTLSAVAKRYLSHDLDLLGIIPESQNAVRAVHARKPLVAEYEDDPASERFRKVAKLLLQRQSASTRIGNLDAERLLQGFIGTRE
ncbi:MAG: hypothetical protein A2X49_07215 [Lentisphaerae bacterium GWF2_52_8]|nr:MAG: hypothetical protein A2X49_07215 [Lentisphaerae bacterium GWF2_52_8]